MAATATVEQATSIPGSNESKVITNWHWKEVDCAPYAKEYLSKQLADNASVSVSTDDQKIIVTVTETDGFDGDVSISNRKAKVRYYYDFSFNVKWKATIKGGESVTGKLKFLEVTHEIDEASDFQYEYSIQNEKMSLAPRIKELVKKSLVPIVADVLLKFPESLKADKSKAVLTDAQIAAAAADISLTGQDQNTNVSAASQVKKAFIAGAVGTKEGTTKSRAEAAALAPKIANGELDKKVEMNAAVEDVFDKLTNVTSLQQWTQGPVVFDAQAGGEFSLFGGHVHGFNDELIENKQLVQRWRLKTWPEGLYSKVTLSFDQKSDGTTVRLRQTGIPFTAVEDVTSNWDRFYWYRIKAVYGYGSFLM